MSNAAKARELHEKLDVRLTPADRRGSPHLEDCSGCALLEAALDEAAGGRLTLNDERNHQSALDLALARAEKAEAERDAWKASYGERVDRVEALNARLAALEAAAWTAMRSRWTDHLMGSGTDEERALYALLKEKCP